MNIKGSINIRSVSAADCEEKGKEEKKEEMPLNMVTQGSECALRT